MGVPAHTVNWDSGTHLLTGNLLVQASHSGFLDRTLFLSITSHMHTSPSLSPFLSLFFSLSFSLALILGITLESFNGMSASLSLSLSLSLLALAHLAEPFPLRQQGVARVGGKKNTRAPPRRRGNTLQVDHRPAAVCWTSLREAEATRLPTLPGKVGTV